MTYRLQNELGGAKNALDIILNNCGNAMYFRTSEIQTRNNVQSRILAPPMANRPHVMRVRTLASHVTRVYYALRCDGNQSLSVTATKRRIGLRQSLYRMKSG